MTAQPLCHVPGDPVPVVLCPALVRPAAGHPGLCALLPDARLRRVASRPAGRQGQPPAVVLAGLPPRHRAGALTWDELLTLCDRVAGAGPPWRLARLVRADPAATAWERYGIFVLGERAGRWIDRPADWVALCAGTSG